MRRAVEIGLRPAQAQVFQSTARFRVLVAGRRFGKTHLALVELLRAACGAGRRVWYVAPSYRQAKEIAWERLKQLTQPWWAARPLEAELTVRLLGGGTIALRGADQPDSLRGSGLDFVVLDEYASMRPETWTEVLRPMLSDRRGGALFLGTPRGSDHLYQLFCAAEMATEWARFRYSTVEGGNVGRDEMAQAAQDMDEAIYRQEFEASFEAALADRVYPQFTQEGNVQPCAWKRGEGLVWSLDFNVSPLCSVLAQRVGDTVRVLDEMVLADSHTERACEELVERTAEWRRWETVRLQLYGDASGFQRRTTGEQTDSGVVREFFQRWRGDFAMELRAVRSNAPVRDRVAAVNARVCNRAGERRLLVDPRCRELIRDLETVRWRSEREGRLLEIDKSDKKRTHASDALGYYLVGALPVRGW